MGIHIKNIDLRILNMTARMPFRYGIVTMTALPHLFVSADVEVNGKVERGISADHLPPKWFTKNPQTHFRDDLVDMIDCIRHACSAAADAGEQKTVYEWWAETYNRQKHWAMSTAYPPLLWGFGVSLVERAVIDAFCRASGLPFWKAVRQNALGMKLAEGAPADWLPSQPLRSLISRHTVGMTDPLTDADIAPADRVNDGLPQSLEECIRIYGLTHFKIKLCGDVEKDLSRMTQIAAVVERNVEGDYALTVDANENFKSVEPFRALWEKLSADPGLSRFLSKLILVEQPLHRDVALSDEIGRQMRAWNQRPPMIIDESDAEPQSLERALACGYSGTSHKNCKGVLKSIANACLLEKLRRENPGKTFLLSAEDLSNVGPVALPADLAVVSALGIAHVERNGQHYFKGLSMFDETIQNQALNAHGDLYRHHESGFVTLDIRNGRINVSSVVDAPFGVGFQLDTSRMTRLEDWKFESLGIA